MTTPEPSGGRRRDRPYSLLTSFDLDEAAPAITTIFIADHFRIVTPASAGGTPGLDLRGVFSVRFVDEETRAAS